MIGSMLFLSKPLTLSRSSSIVNIVNSSATTGHSGDRTAINSTFLLLRSLFREWFRIFPKAQYYWRAFPILISRSWNNNSDPQQSTPFGPSNIETVHLTIFFSFPLYLCGSLKISHELSSVKFADNFYQNRNSFWAIHSTETHSQQRVTSNLISRSL